MEKRFFLLILTIFIGLNLFAKEVKKKDLKTEGMIYYLNGEVFTGKATMERDRYYFKNGKSNGKWLRFYLNGNIKAIINWENGNLNGKYILYKKDGSRSLETIYKNGKEDGIFKTYHDNGVLAIKGKYRLGTPVGTWTYFSEKGKAIGKTVLQDEQEKSQEN